MTNLRQSPGVCSGEFGKQDFSLKSGRSDAFTWPTIGRVGDEAFRMAAQRLGTEGSTGSPVRNAICGTTSIFPWLGVQPGVRQSDREPLATAAPLLYMLNDQGKLLIRLPEVKGCRSSPRFTAAAR
ncbi:virulence factor SrfB [Leclercia adecarboxylata]|uniref:virulence factor SrfB n=1 Tax=Leclercia adecarboxylata TaxID=83655 RepID=UPI0038BC8DC6